MREEPFIVYNIFQ